VILGGVGSKFTDYAFTTGNTNNVDLTANPSGGSPDAWWRLGVDRPRRVRFSLRGTQRVLGVLQGDCGSLVEIESENGPAQGNADFVLDLEPFETYYIVAERSSSPEGGVYDLAVEVLPPDGLDYSITQSVPNTAQWARWYIEFNQDMREFLSVGDLIKSPIGSPGNQYELALTFSETGEDATVHGLPFNLVQSVTMGFELPAGLQGPHGDPNPAQTGSSLHTVVAYPKGDVNKDGAFDINDVLLLSNASTGLATLP
jgi:hypothetical protein